MAVIEIEPKGRFAETLRDALVEKDESLNECAQAVETTYEHMRKLVAGRAYPSPRLLRDLCKHLSGSSVEWLQKIEADKMFKKFKTLPSHLGVSSAAVEIDPILSKLSKDGQEQLIAMAKTLAKQEAARKHEAAKR